MSKNIRNEAVDNLFAAILSLSNREECYRFFDDLLTMNEFVSMAQRVAVARMLYNDEKYTDITYKTGASSATISRVKRCVRYGADGYTLVLRRLTEKTDKK